MAPWLRFLEAYAVQQLLRTPAFHRAVEKVARQVHRIQHGIPPEELGGTKIDQPANSGLLQHFVDEVKTQLGTAERKEVGSGTGVNIDRRAMTDQGTKTRVDEEAKKVVDESAEAAWRETQRTIASSQSQAPKHGILGEFGSALRAQLRGERKG